MGVTTLSVALAQHVVSAQVDLGVCDEGSYSLAGALWPYAILTSNWAPLYSLWHALLLFFIPDRVGEYNFNFILLAACFPVLFYSALRIFKLPIPIALSLFAFALSSFSNLTECPKVNLFALCFLMIGLLASTRIKGESKKFIWLSLTLHIGSYVRPELALATGIFLMFGAFMYRQRPALIRECKLASAGALAIALGLWIALGSPVSDPGYSRATEAYGQMYAKSISADGSDRFYYEWKDLVKRAYGKTPSLLEAILLDPSLTLSTLAQHAQDIVIQTGSITNGLGNSANRVLVLLLTLGVAICSFKGSKRTSHNSLESIFLFAIFAAGLVSLCVAITFPRHIFFSAVTLCLLIVSRVDTMKTTNYSRPLHLALILPWLLLMPSFLSDLQQSSPKPNSELINEVHQTALGHSGSIVICPDYLKAYLTREQYARYAKSCDETYLQNEALIKARTVNCPATNSCEKYLESAALANRGGPDDRCGGGWYGTISCP